MYNRTLLENELKLLKKELKKYDLLNDNSKELETLIEKYNSIVREINSHLLDNIK